MRAVTFDYPGPPDVLQWGDAPDPTPGPGEVLLEVHAAGVNNADLLQRRGQYAVPPGASPILGLEVAGQISQVGGDVTGWAVGDTACALLTGGGYAERVVVPAGQLLPIPAGVDIVSAAAFPEAACTVYANLAMTAHLSAGMTLLVHGGASGIGTFAIQWAKAIGATVITTAGSAEKLERCRALGADTLINYRTDDFVAEILAVTDGRGVDVILDIVGAGYLDRNLQCLAIDGHLVVIGRTGDAPNAPLDLGLLMSRRASISATTLRGRPLEQKAAIVAAVRDNVWPLIDSGLIIPVIDTVLPMSLARDAHQLVTEGRQVGKVVLAAPAAQHPFVNK